MGAELTGDWDKILNRLGRCGQNMKSESSKKIARNLARVERKVLDHVDAQDLGWEPLNKAYADKKEKKGLDPDTLRATNEMYENITTDQPNEFEGSVGVTRGVKTADGDEITDIAIIHEQPDNDGEKIPARKLWEPTFNELKAKIAADLCGVAIKVFGR